jgi:hypothetical protein
MTNHLPDATYAFAPHNKPVMTERQASETIAKTGGWIMANGEIYDLQAVDLGAHMCRIDLQSRY